VCAAASLAELLAFWCHRLRKESQQLSGTKKMNLWIVPMIYVIASAAAGLVLPRIELAYLTGYTVGLSVASAQAALSAAASGMMALTGIIFALSLVMIQFSAIAYSPRLVSWFARDRMLYHSLGVFAATFTYAFFTLAFVDRDGSGEVPPLSIWAVGILLIVSMFLFALLVRQVHGLQITKVLQFIGDKGRDVIGQMHQQFEEQRVEPGTDLDTLQADRFGPISQTVAYSGKPKAITSVDVDALVHSARRAGAVIVMTCAVGDTLTHGSIIFRVHGGAGGLAETELMRALQLGDERTFEQDPKYPLRLLVDIAIKALSPAINDPTTAVQAIDQIEDLLNRLGRHDLHSRVAKDSNGVARLVVPMPTWEDYLALAFDEIRQFGDKSIQVMRRLRAALTSLSASTTPARVHAVQQYLEQLDQTVIKSTLHAADKAKGLEEDRQGLGISQRDLS
jgi:uncharacterized membrane protein